MKYYFEEKYRASLKHKNDFYFDFSGRIKFKEHSLKAFRQSA